MWTEDLADLSVQAIAQLQEENREWSKELRENASALVRLRLAKQISLEDYLARRQLGRHAEVDCRRRQMILEDAILGRRALSCAVLRTVD
jgi:hypothetical protein